MQKTWKKFRRTDNIKKKFHSVEIKKLKYITFFRLTPFDLFLSFNYVVFKEDLCVGVHVCKNKAADFSS